MKKSFPTVLTLGALTISSAFAQMGDQLLGENTTKISDHVWAIMGFPNSSSPPRTFIRSTRLVSPAFLPAPF